MGKLFKRFMEWKALKAIFNMGRRRGHVDPPRFGRFFWDFQAVPGYDFAAALAQRGHVSAIVDRLGYGASDHPDGTKSCIGGQADVAHQVVQGLRSGGYATSSGPSVRFRRVALV